MILVADSGSSKTDWILSLSKNDSLTFSTPGINPYFIGDKDISKLLLQTEEIRPYADQVREIYFFGAGASGPDKHEIVSNGLSAVFKNAFISIDSDLTGSAYATCGNQPGLTCILGTGSNICAFDGKEVIPGNHGLGFILGDEGSGVYFGKKLLTGFFNLKMPADLQRSFKKTYRVDKEDMIHHVYKRPLPNLYIGSFSKFMSQHSEHPYIKGLLKEGFEDFLHSHVKPYTAYSKFPCHFVGSIAWYFKEDLTAACLANEIKPGKILQKPINDLYTFIINRVNGFAL